MKTILATLMLIGMASAGPAIPGAGMEIGVMRPHPSLAAHGGPILSLSIFSQRLTPLPGYEEWGGVWFPDFSENGAEVGVREFAGLFAGHVFLPFGGLVRPGFHFGWVWHQEMTRATDGGEARKEGFSFYYGGKIQFSCFTFLISNKGMGGGINFSL